MFKLLMGFILIVYCVPAVWAKGDNNYWSKIEKLAKKGTPQENIELNKFLKFLTKDQTLTAARQCSEMIQKRFSRDLWNKKGDKSNYNILGLRNWTYPLFTPRYQQPIF